MYIPSFVGVLAFAINCFSCLVIIATGLWILQRVKLPYLPWLIACWVINFPLVVQFNTWFLDYLIGALLLSKGVSLSGIGLFAKRDAMRQYMGWHNFISSVGALAIVLLFVADAVFLVQQLKPSSHDRVTRTLGVMRTFSPFLGFCALVLAIMNHALSLLVTHIEP